MAELLIRPARDEEIEALSALAGRIWRAAYPGIISPAQIEYMLAWMYDPAQLRRDGAAGVTYELLLEDGAPVGFCGYQEVHGELKLHKLYLDVARHGLGLGTRMLRHVEDQARRRGLPKVVLGVNRFNAKAIKAYQRNGYTVRHELKTDIGGGYVMDDYILEKAV